MWPPSGWTCARPCTRTLRSIWFLCASREACSRAWSTCFGCGACCTSCRKSQRFDLVHQLNPVFTGVSLALAGSGLPLVLGTYVARWPDDPDALTSGGGWTGRGAAKGRELIAAMQQRRADALLLTTPAAWNRLPDPEEVRSRIHVIPHGIDTELFSPRLGWDSLETMQAEQQKPSILFLANVLKRKGIFTLIEAFRMVANEFPGLHFASGRRRIRPGRSEAARCRHWLRRPGGVSRPSGAERCSRALPQLQRLLSAFVWRTLRNHGGGGHELRPVFGSDGLRRAASPGARARWAESAARKSGSVGSGLDPACCGHPDERVEMGRYNRRIGRKQNVVEQRGSTIGNNLRHHTRAEGIAVGTEDVARGVRAKNRVGRPETDLMLSPARVTLTGNDNEQRPSQGETK